MITATTSSLPSVRAERRVARPIAEDAGVVVELLDPAEPGVGDQRHGDQRRR